MTSATTERDWAPARPTLVALLCHTFWVVLLCFPMFGGRVLLGPSSDQYNAGFAFRQLWTEYWHAHGAIPQWDPYIFGGLPYIGAMHGDIFYPTAWLRVILPTDLAMSAGFFVHLVLAGFFMYVLLRAFNLPWLAAVAGGIAYQLSGQVASLVNPGHDGKLYVSALAPLAFWAVLRAVRDGQARGYAVLALTVGLALVSPHFQMTYYLLFATGWFALYLVFWDETRPDRREGIKRLALALGAVLLGFAVAGIQLYPFMKYLPYAARGNAGWAYATGWSMPPEETLDALLPQFSGLGPEHYWGRNFAKLHTEYLGVVVLMLATLGLLRTERRRLKWYFIGLAGFFLLVSWGGHTPFYYLIYYGLPMMKKVRAASMSFYLVALAVSAWTAFGVERLQAGESRLASVRNWVIALAAVLLLALAGVFVNIGRSIADPRLVAAVTANADAINLGALRILFLGGLTAALIYAYRAGKVQPAAFGLGLLALIGLDLWSIDRQFFVFVPRAATLYAPDALTQRMNQAPQPYRALNFHSEADERIRQLEVYPADILMAYNIPQVIGYHGNELRAYDDLLGGKNVNSNILQPHLWQLLAVRFVILPDTFKIPGYHRVAGPAPTTPGRPGVLYEADTAPAYARVIPAAVKGDSDRIVPTLVDPRLDYNRLVLFAPKEPINPLPVDSMPPPSAARASVTQWQPGRMTVTLNPAPAAASYVLVAENWYPDWHAAVDGAPATPLRGDQTFLTVPVPAGAKTVELWFDSPAYARGKLISLAACVVLAGLLLWPAAAGLRRRG